MEKKYIYKFDFGFRLMYMFNLDPSELQKFNLQNVIIFSIDKNKLNRHKYFTLLDFFKQYEFD